MNKNYRVIWNAVRQCFVVASEAVRARGKSSSSSKAVVAAALAALFVAPAAQAADCAAPIVSTELNSVQVFCNENVTVTNAGKIIVDNSTVAAVVPGIYSSTFTNNGSLSVDGTWASALYFYGDVSGTVLNNNTINAYASSNEGIYANGVYVSGALSGSIDNKGTIAAEAAYASYGSAAGIYVNQVDGGSIANSGLIDVAVGSVTVGSAYGISVEGSLDGQISNSGTISVSAGGEYFYSNPHEAYAYGISVGAGLAEGALISNSGTITARANASGSSASATVYL